MDLNPTYSDDDLTMSSSSATSLSVTLSSARIYLSAVVLAILLLGVGVARAEESTKPFTIGAQGAWFLLGGITGGGSYASEEDFGGFVGGEVSLAFLESSWSPGLYVDGVYDFDLEHVIATVGPQLALHLSAASPTPKQPFALGVDGGLAVRFGDEDALGAAVRGYFSILGVFSFYGRYMVFDDAFARHVTQFGMSIKFPLTEPWSGPF